MTAALPLVAPPCLIPDMPADVYHSIHAMSAGGLRRMAQSPAHFYGMQLDPDRPQPGPPTDAMIRGTLFHSILFEPDTVRRLYATVPDDAPRRPTSVQRAAKKPSPDTLAAIDWWASFEAEHAGKTIVDADLIARCQRMAAAVRRLPDVGTLLADGQAEASAFWSDEASGELCKCRPDWTSPAGDGVILVDGKSCGDASPAGFARHTWGMRYDLQAAWYSDGYERATGKRVHAFVFAAVEADWPHAAAAYVLDDEAIDRARAKNRELLDLYAQCRRTGQWPGYQTHVQPLALPAWAK